MCPRLLYANQVVKINVCIGSYWLSLGFYWPYKLYTSLDKCAARSAVKQGHVSNVHNINVAQNKML